MDKMPDLLKGQDDAIIAENVKMLKNRGFDEASAVKMAQEYAQNMSDITSAVGVGRRVAKPLAMAAPSERPVGAGDTDNESGEAEADDEKAEY